LALTLSVILMFCQFVASQFENELLTAVDRRVEAELVGRFQEPVATTLGTAALNTANPSDVKTISQAIVEATQQVASLQTNLLRDAIMNAQASWDRVVRVALDHMRDDVDDTLRASAIDHVQDLTRAEEISSDRVERRWHRFEEVLMENAKVMREQQAELARQGDTLLRTVEGTDDINRLQRALTKNLASLSNSQHFVDTLTNLTGAVNMLATRITDDEQRPTLKLFAADRGVSGDRGVSADNEDAVYENANMDNPRRAA